jgi:hypothetical protein
MAHWAFDAVEKRQKKRRKAAAAAYRSDRGHFAPGFSGILLLVIVFMDFSLSART